jgi:hypothetical protein
LEHKKRILDQQQQLQRQNQQKQNFGYNPKPHFNRPQYAPQSLTYQQAPNPCFQQGPNPSYPPSYIYPFQQ